MNSDDSPPFPLNESMLLIHNNFASLAVSFREVQLRP